MLRVKKFRRLNFTSFFRYFAMDSTVTDIAQLTGIPRHTVADTYERLRRKIARCCERSTPIPGTVEVDESYFGLKHVPVKQVFQPGRRPSGVAHPTQKSFCSTPTGVLSMPVRSLSLF
jgi:hypothetical protein